MTEHTLTQTAQRITLTVTAEGKPIPLPVGPVHEHTDVTVDGGYLSRGITPGLQGLLHLPDYMTGQTVTVTYIAGGVGDE